MMPPDEGSQLRTSNRVLSYETGFWRRIEETRVSCNRTEAYGHDSILLATLSNTNTATRTMFANTMGYSPWLHALGFLQKVKPRGPLGRTSVSPTNNVATPLNMCDPLLLKPLFLYLRGNACRHTIRGVNATFPISLTIAADAAHF